jgi:hypothetical protein
MPEMSVSFVNSALLPSATDSYCWDFARNAEKTEFGEAYRAANESYLRLTRIAKPVQTKEEAFALIARAYGSADAFLSAIEGQRRAFESIARGKMRKPSTFLEGLAMFFAARSARGFQKKLRKELTSF